MVDLSDLASQLEGQLNTNGWDAVCAINVANLNLLCLNWYLSDGNSGPLSPNTPVQVIYPSESVWYVLDAVVGPPELSFQVTDGEPEVTVTMVIAGGVWLVFDPASSTIQSALILQQAVATISGTASLSVVSGETTLGDVVLEIGNGEYITSVSSAYASPLQPISFDNAFNEYFADNGVSLKLGGVSQVISPQTQQPLPAYLQPQTFELTIQTNPENPGDGCVLLLIQTNGSPGTVGPLPVYPIPDGYTAALLLSNQVIFNQLLPSQLNASQEQVAFEGFQQELAFGTRVKSFLNFIGAVVDTGVLQFPGSPGLPYSSNGTSEHWWSTQYQSAPVQILVANLTFASSGGQLTASLSTSWSQGWAFTPPIGSGTGYNTANTTVSFDASAPVTVSQPSTCIATFPWNGSPSCGVELGWTLQEAFGSGVSPGGEIVNALVGQLTAAFSTVTADGVDTFALQSLLFYPNPAPALQLPTGSLPCDLLLVGSTVPALSISPPSVSITSGDAPVQFTASLNGEPVSGLLWQLSPREANGSIDTNGVYTPPATVYQPNVVVVSATDAQTTQLSGSAMILLYEPAPAGGLTVSPATLTLTAGQAASVQVTDSSGSQVDVSWSLSSSGSDSGSMSSGSDGSWQYTAPGTVDEVTTVTLTAASTSDAQQTGSAAFTLAPTASVTISASASTVSAGQTIQLNATVPPSLPALSWLIYPVGTGSIQAEYPGYPATYTAPSSIDESTTVWIVAYCVGGVATAAGVGMVTITVTPD